MTTDPKPTSFWQRVICGVGPAIIVACVVLGPGSILTSSKVGCQTGYQMAWILVGAGVLMFGSIAAAARVGVTLEHSPCTELAQRLGRPLALVAGVSVFLIASCFQFSNNLGVLASVEPLFDLPAKARGVILVALNVALALCLFGLQRLYARIERLMMALMGLMLIGFAANLILARPSLILLLQGLIPSMPDELQGSFLPRVDNAAGDAAPRLVDPWIAVQGLIATSFSIAGAFYQAYLVREKGWTRNDLGRGLTDSLVGTSVLIGITLVIMATSAAVLYGKTAPEQLNSAGDVARQLEPLFGSAAKWLFCLGIFAGATSSFLVNSMVGGTLLADGLGKDAAIDSIWTKLFTVLVLAIGMVVALATTSEGRVPLIIFAQAATVLGGPILAASLLYLATRRVESGARVAPGWMIGIAGLGGLVVIAFAFRTLVRIYLTLTLP